MHESSGGNIEVKTFIKHIPQIHCFHVRARSHTEPCLCRSGSTELSFSVVSDPGELLYRPRKQLARLITADQERQSGKTSRSGKWVETGVRGLERAQSRWIQKKIWNFAFFHLFIRQPGSFCKICMRFKKNKVKILINVGFVGNKVYVIMSIRSESDAY